MTALACASSALEGALRASGRWLCGFRASSWRWCAALCVGAAFLASLSGVWSAAGCLRNTAYGADRVVHQELGHLAPGGVCARRGGALRRVRCAGCARGSLRPRLLLRREVCGAARARHVSARHAYTDI